VNRRWLIYLPIAAALTLGVVGLARHRTRSLLTTAPGPVALAPLVAPVESRPAETGMLGVVLAQESVDLVPKLEGRLDQVHVRLGDHVARGALIASLDTRSIQRDMAMGEAQLEAARTDVSKAELELAEAQDRLARRRAPLQAGIPAVSGDELAVAEFRFKQAGPSLAAARAHVAERQARVDQLKQSIEDAVVRAPFDGVVAARFVDPGAVVGSHTPVVRLISSSDLWVRFAVPEETAARLSVGLPVRVRVGGADQVLSGIIEKVAPEVDAASRMIFAEARLQAAGGTKARRLSGGVARVTIANPASAKN
jgi:RND family efflux transporter MFP subunit